MICSECDREIADRLTEREARAVRLVAQGLSNKEVGAIMYVVEATVKNYLVSAGEKLSRRGRVRLAVWWVLEGYKEYGDEI